jgi:hypothetical protein
MGPLNSLLNLFGVNLQAGARAVRGLGPFFANKRRFMAEYRRSEGKEFPPGKLYPCLTDRYEQSSGSLGVYFVQDLYVAQLVFKNNPRRHVDVGSRIDGFVGSLASFRPVDVLDIRPLTSVHRNISFIQADLMSRDFPHKQMTDSLSCLHTLEHFGLGRYGDPINYDGWKIGFDNLASMVTPGGTFYFSTPISERQRFEFDAHRVFNISTHLKLFEGRFDVRSFAYIDDSDRLHTGVDVYGQDARRSFGLKYGAGIWELVRR